MEMTERLEDTLPGTFEPDVILPSQFHDLRKNRQILQGERKLMFAVLEDAIFCYLKYMDAKNRNRRLLFLEASEWINSSRSTGLFSFDVLCNELGLDADALRGALDQRRRRHQSGRLYVSRRRKAAARLAASPEAVQQAATG